MIAATLALTTPASAAQPRLWKVGENCGEISKLTSGECGGAAGETVNPAGIAANPDTGHLYVAEINNGRISEFTAWGVFVKAWGWGVRDGSPELQTCGSGATPPSATCQSGLEGDGPGQLDGSAGVAIDSAGNVYVAETDNRRVQKFSPEGEFLLMFGGGVNQGPNHPGNVCTAAHIAEGDTCGAGTTGTDPGQFGKWPLSSFIAVGPADEVYVGDVDRIQRFDSAGAYQGEIELPEAGTVFALAADPVSGDLYFSYFNNNGIEEPGFGSKGIAAQPDVHRLDPLTGEELGSLPVGNPKALAADAAGNVYVFELGWGSTNSIEQPYVHPARIFKFGPDGELAETVAQNKTSTFLSQIPRSEEFQRSFGLAANTVTEAGAVDLYASNFEQANSYISAFGPPPDRWPPPPAAPSIVAQYALSAGTTDATLGAQVNPHFWKDAAYYVEYGTQPCSEGGCAKQPAPPGSQLGSGVTDEPFPTAGVFLAGLKPDTTYHYRFVAQSGGGGPVRGKGGTEAQDGTEATFTTFPEPTAAGPCPNDALRTGASAILPDCRAYEMVSPVDKEGGDVALARGERLDQSSSSGDFLAYTAKGANHSQHLASRGAEGWSAKSITPPAEAGFAAFSDDLEEGWLASAAEPVLAPGAITGYSNLYRRDNTTGGYEACTTTKPPTASAASYDPLLQGVGEANAAVFAATDGLTANAPPGTKRQLYSCREGQLHLASVLPDQSPSALWNTAGSASDPSDLAHTATLADALSADASRLYWTASPGESGEGSLYLRVNADQPESARQAGAATGTGNLIGPTAGVGTVISGSTVVSNVELSKPDPFAIGQQITDSNGGIPAGTTIVKVEEPKPEVFKLTLSAKATKTKSGDELTGLASATVSNLATKTGAFAVGQEISGTGIPVGTTVVALGAGTLTLSVKAATSGTAVALSATSSCTEAAKACTLAVSKGTNSRFWAASPDGSAALFTEGEDLYRYDVATVKATLLASKVKGVLGQSADLSRVYLVSTESLGGEGSAGQPNLYISESGDLELIATLSARDAEGGGGQLSSVNPRPDLHTARASADGQALAFASDSSALADAVAGYDNTEQGSGQPAAEIYRYEATSEELDCLSCTRSGARPQGREVGGLTAAALIPTAQTSLYPGRPLSSDGSRLFFDSYTPLLPQDTNGKADVYQWEEAGSGDCGEGKGDYSPPNGGCVSLISTGKASQDSEFVDASPEGDDAFILTGESLVAHDPGEADLYDARVNGGFAGEGEEEPEGIPLTVKAEGTGTGTVSADKGAISCSPFCTDEYAGGTKVTLTATPSAGSTFYSWKKCDAGGVNGRQCTVAVDKAKTVTAVFATTNELTVTKAGGMGKVQSSPGGILCLANCPETTAAFLEGAKVTLKATPAKRFALAEWTGDCSGTGTCELTMGEDHEVGALFTEVPRHLLTLSKTGGGAGTVKSEPAGINCGLTCSTQSSSFYEGDLIVLTATPGKGSAFAGWSGGGCSGKGTCEVTIDAAKGVEAEFK